MARNTNLVWRIYHFKERFEMDGYVRQGGLDYVRMFVTATTKDKSNESSEFLKQLEELEHYYPEQRDAYEGRFWRISRLTATLEDWVRGYLLDADQRPLSLAKIAARLHLSLPIMKQTLVALKRVGLLECIEYPALERPAREEQKEDDAKKQGGRGGRKGGHRRRKDGSAKAAAMAISKRFETFGNISENSKSIQESEYNRNRNTNQKEILGLTSSDPTSQSQTPSQAQANNKAQENAQGPTATRTPTPPATTPPMDPTVSDAEEARVISFRPPPPESADPLHISCTVAGIRRRCNPVIEQAARLIYKALGAPWADGSRQQAQDMGCFRSAVERIARSGLSPPAAAELWESLITEAKRLRRLYAKNGGYVAAKKVWFKPILRDKLAAKCAGA